MQIAKRTLLVFVVAIVVVNGNSRLGCGQTSPPKTSESWARENYAAALAMILPAGEIAVGQFPKDVKWIVTVRILPPFEKPEYRFSMQRFYDGRVEVSATKIKGASLLSQLQILKTNNPDDSVQKIVELVSLDKLKLTQSQKPELTQLAHKFETISISPVLPDELRVDDTGYEFWSQSLWGNRMTITLGGPGLGARRQPQTLLEWAESVRSVIEAPARRNGTVDKVGRKNRR